MRTYKLSHLVFKNAASKPTRGCGIVRKQKKVGNFMALFREVDKGLEVDLESLICSQFARLDAIDTKDKFL